MSIYTALGIIILLLGLTAGIVFVLILEGLK